MDFQMNKMNKNYELKSFIFVGILFGLGLNNTFAEPKSLNLHNYLKETHNLTTIGALLGIAAERFDKIVVKLIE